MNSNTKKKYLKKHVFNKNKVEKQMLKDESDGRYLINQAIPNKPLNIASYLVHKISPLTGDFKFTTTGLAKKFHCSRMTIYRTLQIMKKIPRIKVTDHSITEEWCNTPQQKGGHQHEEQ